MYPITIYPEKDDFNPVTLVGGTGFLSQGRAKLRVFWGKTAGKIAQPSPSLTRKPCTVQIPRNSKEY